MSREPVLLMAPIIPVRPRLVVPLAIALASLLYSRSAPAQNGPIPAAVSANPAQVTIDLRAVDKKGNAITDLKASEVEVIDGGVPVRLEGLRFGVQPQVPDTIAFVFDQVVPGVAKTDRALAEEFLKAVAARGFRFMVLKVEGRLHLVQAPTLQVDAIKKAIAAATIADRAEYIKATEAAEKQITEEMATTAGPRQATARQLMAMLMDSQNTVRDDARSTPSVAALLAAARGQQDVPGRKSILYFSQGLAWHSNTPESLRDIVQAANRARVSIYSFDAEIGSERGAAALSATNALGTAQAMGGIASGASSLGPSAEPPGTGTQANEYKGRMEASENAGSPQTLAGICASTGGMHVLASGGEGRRGAGDIATDLNSYYLASWMQPGAGGDNRLHSIRVRSLRKGVSIRARSGYYPARAGNTETVSGVEARLLAALAMPDLPADLPFNARILRFGNTPDNDVNSVVVQVPLDRPGAEPATSGVSEGNVSVLAQVKDNSGVVVRKFSADIPRRRAPTDPQQTRPEVINFRRQFSAPPGEYTLESVAMDGNGGKIGAQRDRFTIPPVAEGLALGDVVLVRRVDPANDSPAIDPLRCAEGIVVPNLSGRVSKAESPSITLFFNLHPDPGSNEAPTLSAELRRNDVLIGTVPLALAADPTRQAVPYLATLAAGALRPGAYQMTVILSQGGKTVSQNVSFNLE